jgi:multiple sugar transport system substrate-binding protein
MKEIITENEVSRRSVLKGAAAGAAALAAGGYRCLNSRSSRPQALLIAIQRLASVQITRTPPGPEEDAAWVAAAAKARRESTLQLNVVDHNTFQTNINSYLQGTPDNVFDWFSGYRMQFFAQKGLLTPIDDVWKPSYWF